MWTIDQSTGARIEDRREIMRQSIELAVKTYRGDRFGNVAFGTTIEDRLFTEAEVTADLIVTDIENAVIELIDVSEIDIRSDVDSLYVTINGEYEIEL